MLAAVAAAVKEKLRSWPRLPPLAFLATTPALAPALAPAATARRGSHAAASPVVSHASLLLRLRSCSSLEEAQRLHAALLVGGHRYGTVLVAQLVRVYAKLGEIAHALRVFDGMPRRNSFAWNAVIKGLVDAGEFSEALEMFWEMVRDGSVMPDGFTYPPVIKACAALGAVEQGRKVWGVVEADVARGNARPNLFVQCALVDMFAKCGCFDEARNVFESMQVRDLAVWTAMIGGAVHAACGRAGELQVGTALHGCAVKSGG
ncbi:hypothetical protein E2562_013309 [Oryza meyeriana var. granulata]|uniref:Pentacotripeptide-repeat region of PRORP domain-containing protein n=1 Tax=Oryza meyeriana var. granulata TaxID=110450 RepID=A0A6G1D208_9ORYZ|nr:hypothetical protein E2562_013309 [Oryza meyeriana var. granulata]